MILFAKHLKYLSNFVQFFEMKICLLNIGPKKSINCYMAENNAKSD